MSTSRENLFTLDTKDFDQKFLLAAQQTMPKVLKKALWAATSELKNDADNVAPKTPHLHGHLRGEHKILVKLSKDSCHAELVFEMPYAARWHEAEGNVDPVTGAQITWSEASDGVGPKYVETKMIRFHAKYFEIVADYARSVWRGRGQDLDFGDSAGPNFRED